MTNDALLKWVAEELLGWEAAYGPSTLVPNTPHDWASPDHRLHSYNTLESWHGIGLVIDKMQKKGFCFMLGDLGDQRAYRCSFWIKGEGLQDASRMYAGELYLAVFSAAHKAVTHD